MILPTASASLEELQRLPVPARPRVDPRDMVVPEGYEGHGRRGDSARRMLAARLMERSPIEDQEEAASGSLISIFRSVYP